MAPTDSPTSRPKRLLLLLIRHGETTWNAENRLQGHRDVPLSETGRVQARRLARRLSAAWRHDPPLLPGPPAAVFSSDLARAVETASLLLPGSDTVRQSLPALRERGFGDWEGLTPDEIRARFPGQNEPPGGEAYAEVWQRTEKGLRAIWNQTSAADSAPTAGSQPPVALIVGHGGALRTVLCHALGIGLEALPRFQLKNVSLSIVEFQGPSWEQSKGRILLLNDTAHLNFPDAFLPGS